jgi:hypothetical protein
VLTGEAPVQPQRSWSVDAPATPSWGGRLPTDAAPEAEETYTVPSGPTHEGGHSLISSAGFENRDLALEGDLMAMGLWNRIYGILMGVAAVCLGVAAMAAAGHANPGAGVVAAVVLGAVALLCWAVGDGVSKLMEWARVVSMVLCGLGALAQVLKLFTGKGSEKLVALLTLVYLAYQATILSKASAICTESYRDAVATSGIKASPYKSVAFFWLPMVGLILVVVGVMLIGFAAAAMHSH